MSLISFIWFVVTIVVVVGCVLGLKWALDYLETPDRPKKIIMVVVVVVAAAFLIVYVLRMLGSVTLYS